MRSTSVSESLGDVALASWTYNTDYRRDRDRRLYPQSSHSQEPIWISAIDRLYMSFSRGTCLSKPIKKNNPVRTGKRRKSSLSNNLTSQLVGPSGWGWGSVTYFFSKLRSTSPSWGEPSWWFSLFSRALISRSEPICPVSFSIMNSKKWVQWVDVSVEILWNFEGRSRRREKSFNLLWTCVSIPSNLSIADIIGYKPYTP